MCIYRMWVGAINGSGRRKIGEVDEVVGVVEAVVGVLAIGVLVRSTHKFRHPPMAGGGSAAASPRQAATTCARGVYGESAMYGFVLWCTRCTLTSRRSA
jgi:hypothetical protein